MNPVSFNSQIKSQNRYCSTEMLKNEREKGLNDLLKTACSHSEIHTLRKILGFSRNVKYK